LKILILTQWYPPEPALLLQELAQTLLARGHDVTVLTGFPNYPSGMLYPGYHIRLHQHEVLAGVPVERVPLYPEHSRSTVGRVFNYVSFALSSAVLGPFLVKRPDVIFVYHPPLTIGLSAILLGGLWRVPFVYQIQDMWPETLRATGVLRNKRLLDWVSSFAQFVYSRASRILVISPGFRRNLLSKGVSAEKVDVVSNWVEFEDGSLAQFDSGLATDLGLLGRFNIMFAGNMGEAQGLETVVEAAGLLQDLPEIQFVLVGDGVALSRLKLAVQDRNLPNVRFLGRYPQQMMPSLYSLTDVLLVHLKKEPLFEITIPHKVLTYLGAGRPILAAVAGDAASLVIEAGAGLVCPPENPQALCEAVRRLYLMPLEERRTLGKHGLQAAHTRFSRNELVGQIEAVLQAAARRP
jgi:glycosyltransferase involved in cell wall biosynthesis